jgi:hypothetical protein
MKKFVFAICAAAMCSAGLAAAPKDDVPVTITGCVHDGDDGSYVFTNVVDLTESATKPASAVYWLSTTKGLKDHVGHKVEVSGTYSPSRDKGKTAKVKIETDATDGEMKVAVENGMKKAEIDEPIPVGTSGTVEAVGDSKMELVRPYRRLEVKSIKMLAASCQ